MTVVEMRYEGRCEWCRGDVVVIARHAPGIAERAEGFDISSCPVCGCLFPIEMWRVR